MNYQKIDPSLAMALNEVQDPEKGSLKVFIHTEPIPDATAAAMLERLAVSTITSAHDVFAATLSANAIFELAEQPWVQYIRLSQKLGLVDRK